MSLVVPNALEVEILNDKLNTPLTLRLYGNNKVPAGADVAANYTEIAGGGYASLPLVFANWTITAGDPSLAVYNTTQIWTFTGVINAPGTIYGYFVTRNSDGKLMWAERFPAFNVPFTPIAGSVIRVAVRFSAQSQF
jgi:hypothetical protein